MSCLSARLPFGIALVLACLFQHVPARAQHYTQEIDYATSDVRCPKGTHRDTQGVCRNARYLYWQIQSKGGTLYWVDGAIGNDNNSGAKRAPWKTIGRATQPGVLQPGDGVVIRKGTYYESIRPSESGMPGRPIVFVAHKKHNVVISGAEPIDTPWTQVGGSGVWWTDWSDSRYDFPYIRQPGEVLPEGNKLFYQINASETVYDDARRREVIIADGVMYRPYYEKPSGASPYDHALSGAALAGMPEGTFYLNELEQRMYVRLLGNANPSNRVMQTSTKNHLFNPSDNNFDCADANANVRNHIHVVGLTFEHVSNAPQQGAVCSGREGSAFNNVTVRWTNGAGLLIAGDDHRVTDVGAYDNGMSGIRGGVGPARGCTGCLVENSESFRNNKKGFDPFWESGGGKWQYTTHSIFRNLNFSGNYGPGLWLDIKNHHNIIENSRFHGNFGVNLFVEFKSDQNLIYNNVSTHAYTSIIDPSNHLPNHDYDKWKGVLRLEAGSPVDVFGYGMQIHAASHNQVLFNTMMSNDGGGLRIRYDARDSTRENIFYNNIMMNFLDHEFYTDNRHRGHEVALQNFDAANRDLLRTNTGEGNNYWSHYIEGQPLTYYASFLYRLFESGGAVAQLRTNNINKWRDSTFTDLTSRMVNVALPHVEDPTQWEYGWCMASGSQFLDKAKPLPPVVDQLLGELPGEHAPISHAHVGSAMSCPAASQSYESNNIARLNTEALHDASTHLGSNYPNPFSYTTNIPFRLERSMHVQLKMYDVLGREVLTLADGEMGAGTHNLIFEASHLPSGLYMLEMVTPEGTFVKKVSRAR